MHVAAEDGSMDSVRTLLRAGEAPQTCDNDGDRARHCAILRGNEQIAAELYASECEAGAGVEEAVGGWCEKTILTRRRRGRWPPRALLLCRSWARHQRTLPGAAWTLFAVCASAVSLWLVVEYDYGNRTLL